MKFGAVIALIGLLWMGYKLLMANGVKGKKAEIKPFRRESKLKSLGVINVTLNETERKGDDIWFVCPLEKEIKINNLIFDYIRLKPKSVDDNFGVKKAVIAHVLGGNSKSNETPKFIDWGVVRVLE